jgi:hypothetical protein
MMLELEGLPDLEAAAPPPPTTTTLGAVEKSVCSGDPMCDAAQEDVCSSFTTINFLRVSKNRDGSTSSTIHILKLYFHVELLMTSFFGSSLFASFSAGNVLRIVVVHGLCADTVRVESLQ